MPTTSSATPSPSVSALAAPPHGDHRLVILGITLGIIGAILVAGILVMTARFRRGQPIDEKRNTLNWARKSIMPTSRVTPFGSAPSEMPQHVFTHKPGENMRMARRRSDGAWIFSDPRTPFRPAGVRQLDIDLVPPSPSGSSFTSPRTPQPSPSLKKYPVGYSKEYEIEQLRYQEPRSPGRFTEDSEISVEDLPPPAYAYDSRDLVRGSGPDWSPNRRS